MENMGYLCRGVFSFLETVGTGTCSLLESEMDSNGQKRTFMYIRQFLLWMVLFCLVMSVQMASALKHKKSR
jgi:hypothetical protein